MDSSEIYTCLKASNILGSILGRGQKCHGSLGTLVPAPAFCLLSAPFIPLNEYRCLEYVTTQTDQSLDSLGRANWTDESTLNPSHI